MATFAPIIGNHVFLGGFDGETVDSSTVDEDNPPDYSPQSNWRNMGCINNADFERTYNDENILYCPSPGSYKETGRKYGGTTMIVRVGLQNPNVDFWQIGFGASSLDGSNVFTPDSQGQPRKGWIQIQSYESASEDNLVNLKFWAQMQVDTNFSFANAPTQPVLRLLVLDNILNSGQFLSGMATATP